MDSILQGPVNGTWSGTGKRRKLVDAQHRYCQVTWQPVIMLKAHWLVCQKHYNGTAGDNKPSASASFVGEVQGHRVVQVKHNATWETMEACERQPGWETMLSAYESKSSSATMKRKVPATCPLANEEQQGYYDGAGSDESHENTSLPAHKVFFDIVPRNPDRDLLHRPGTCVIQTGTMNADGEVMGHELAHLYDAAGRWCGCLTLQKLQMYRQAWDIFSDGKYCEDPTQANHLFATTMCHFLSRYDSRMDASLRTAKLQHDRYNTFPSMSNVIPFDRAVVRCTNML